MTCATQTLTPRRRVEIALSGHKADRVPFTIYEKKIPQCTAERAMRNRGMCIVRRDVPVYTIHQPNVKSSRHITSDSGRTLQRTVHQTSKGTLSTLVEGAGFTNWYHEKMFKSPDDYAAILAFIEDEQYEPNYAAFDEAQDRFGEDAVFRATFGLEPLQALISGPFMSMTDFCEQWMDNRDEILKLYRALVEKRRTIYPIVARSPALHANYGGNVTPEIIGLETFEQYYLPHYHEAAEIMHRRGKLIGCHFDANCKLLAQAIASTELDYLEAFTPAPDTDMTLAEARRAWPGKVLWLNFPSSQHLQDDKRIVEITCNLLDEAGSVDGLIMGITEDIPENRWRNSCPAIMDGLEKHAREKRDLYRNG